VRNELTYDELSERYRISQIEISELKKSIQKLEAQDVQKKDFNLSQIIFDEAVKKFVNLLPLVMFQADIEGNFLFLNQFAIKSFGYTQEDFKRGMNIRQVLDNEHDFERIREGFKTRLKTEELKAKPYTLKKKDGSLFYGLIYSTAHIGDDNDPTIFGIVINHTEYQNVYNELLKTQKELKELNAAKDKLFSIIAHDLKNPFNAISGFSELLLNDINEYSIEQIESYIRIILKSSSKGYDLLENLLEWTRSQTGNLAIRKANFGLSELIQESLEFNREKAIIKNIKLSANCNESLFVSADRNMINTVLRNLITNALKFTNNGGAIKISVIEFKVPEQEKLQVKISVKDTGIGIKKGVLDKLFKLDKSYTTKGTDFEQGTGLGLILCKDFVEKSGGKIWAESEFGKGSTFYFTLPMQE